MDTSKLLLIEGTAGVGKSALTELLFKKYIEEEKRKVRSMLHLDQAYTYHPLHPDRINNPLTKEENQQHLDTIFQMLSWYAHYVPAGTPHQFYCIIETLHITQCFRPGVLRLKDVLRYDRRLAEQDCRLVFLKVNPETLWERCIKARQDNEFITQYGKKYGTTLDEIHGYYVEEQALMERVIGKSVLEKLTVELDGPIYKPLEETYEFWMKD
jgi:thymidylate kinase